MQSDERPVQDWYPRARVSLVVRFEEFGSKPSAVPPKTKQTLRKGTSGDKELEYVRDPAAPAGTTRYVLQPKGGSKISAASADKLTHPLWGIVPATASHGRNGLDKCDTLTLEIAYLDAPFDPRCIRSCAVEYYLGTITPDEAAREPFSATPTMVPDSFVDARGKRRTNRRFRGWADTWEVDMKDGQPTVKLECRDGRSVLIDQPSPPQLHLDPKLPLDKAIADYLSNFPQFSGLSVEWRGDGDAPTLDKIVASKGQDKGTKTGKDKSSVMDYLTDMVGAAGCILLMEDETVIVSKPRTVLKRGASRTNDPYTGTARSINGMELRNRTFIYGHNCSEMRFGRKFNAAAPSTLEVRAYLPNMKKTIFVRFPDVTTTVMPGGAADSKIMVWRVQGVTSVDQLKVIAQSCYEQGARKELSVEVSTKDLASFGGDNQDPDLLDILPGDSFDALLMREMEGATSVGEVEDAALVRGKLIGLMVSMGHGRELAEAYAASYMAGGFQTTFRTRTVKTDFNNDSGVSVSVTGCNYVEVRLDKELT